MSNVKFANALINNLTIFDSAGYEIMGLYSQLFLDKLATDDDLTPVVAEYRDDIKRLTESVSWIRPEGEARAKRLVDLTTRWVNNIDRDADAKELIDFLKK